MAQPLLEMATTFGAKTRGDARRRFGRYYTPPQLVSGLYRLLGSALESEGLSPRDCALVDPACGDGAFLGAEEAEGFRRRLGLDLDAAAVEEARRGAAGALIIRGDAYGEGLDALRAGLAGSGPVAVVGNPPYVGNSELLRSGRYQAVRDRLLPFAREVASGASIRDDYVLFFGVADQVIEAAGGRGAIAYVTSASFVDNFLYAPMRRWLLSRYRLHALVEAGSHLFEGARVATVLSVWVRAKGDPRRAFKHARLPGASSRASAGRRLEALGAGFELAESVPQGELLLLNAPDAAVSSTIERMREAGDPIGQVLRISSPGLKTRFDELLTAPTREALAARMKDFFSATDAGEFAARHRLPASGMAKLQVAFEARERTAYSEQAIRSFARYGGPKHRFRVPPEAMAFAYVDRELIPRGDHRFRGAWDPHREGPKLVFNAREVPLSAAVVEGPACVHDYRHSRFAPLWVPRAMTSGRQGRPSKAGLGELVLNLTPRWEESARLLREPADVFWFACAVFNSRLVQEVFAPVVGASEEVPLPRFGERDADRVQALADHARSLAPGELFDAEGERILRRLFGVV